ncbi:MAG TPA: mycofactocin-coupled SDR family oxidoreductase [Baekduia sp.]|uniref:mycofactocin-coupled SDR family oxidoreductase n=1 Tax=Baekduia sp. TaxID=2600305 RepID=UPI002D76CB6F|nr:mycofactocin-coupled SDR family oxidoreductase [Baekduia sp.]HET6509977.1 mycofactocin-coupled SDR family oxidoreductase [Baekduia sp.]
MGMLDGKVALITGAARGQGRSHAVRLAEEGADVIAIDICDQIPSIKIPMSTREDLAETERLVTALGRRVVTAVGDVRDRPALAAIVSGAVDELGRLDIVVANAGVWGANPDTPGGPDARMEPAARDTLFRDIIETNLIGVWNTLQATVGHVIAGGRGGAIVLTSSTAGLHGMPVNDFAQDAYTASKHGIVGLMRSAAVDLAPHDIRVNTVNPTGVRTPMAENQVVADYFGENPDLGNLFGNALDVDMVEAVDVSNAIVYLVGDSGRYVTGVTLPVDAGFLAGGALARKG